jgi:hypothetical protein
MRGNGGEEKDVDLLEQARAAAEPMYLKTQKLHHEKKKNQTIFTREKGSTSFNEVQTKLPSSFVYLSIRFGIANLQIPCIYRLFLKAFHGVVFAKSSTDTTVPLQARQSCTEATGEATVLFCSCRAELSIQDHDLGLILLG